MAKRNPIDEMPPDMKRRLRRSPEPKWVPPMLATLIDVPFSREGWLFEPKLDGERCLALRSGAPVSDESAFVRRSNRSRLPLPQYFLRSLIIAEPQKPWMPKFAVCCPLGKADLGDQFWFDPTRAVASYQLQSVEIVRARSKVIF